MPSDDARFAAALVRIDAANAHDPHGRELLYSQRMSAWLDRIAPQAPEALKLAARAQHIRRWVIPRSDYPMDRIGYLKWRTTHYKFHADETAQILSEVGYDPATIARVASLIRKEQIKTDPDAQTLEDVICLVFLENYFAAFAAEHEAEKVINIVRRTWKKMSERGRALALTVEIPPTAKSLVERALASET
jgi:hypothetical protein